VPVESGAGTFLNESVELFALSLFEKFLSVS
jgi:hypothetical protein